MSELLIEIYSEEIPARMQVKAAEDFKKIFAEFFEKQNIKLKEGDLATFVTPRRLVLSVQNLSEKQISPAINKMGPKVGAPEAAILGFLKSVGLSDISKLEKITRDNGEYYFYKQPESNVDTLQILEKNLPNLLDKMHNSWAKTMDLIDTKNQSNWVRPVRNLLAMFNGKVLNIEFENQKANNQTFGHLLCGKKALQVNGLSDYKKQLEENCVIISWPERRSVIVTAIEKIDASLVQKNSKLIDEITGLVEYPQVLVGKIDDEFKNLPEEVLELVIKLHQKAILLKNNSLGFIFVSNVKANEAATLKIIADNEKVVRARLSDAKFYIEEDLKIPFESRIEALKNITFHKKLGSLYHKTKRLDVLNKLVSLWVPNAHMAHVEKLADFAKNDLSTKTVAELPELQGVIGAYYLRQQKYPEQIADAVKEQYLPVGQDSKLPQTNLGIVLSIADKIDNIASLFFADEKPTASKDPYALRRAALGIIKIIFENKIPLPIRIAVDRGLANFPNKALKILHPKKDGAEIKEIKINLAIEITEFFVERAKPYIKEQYGYRTEVINQVFDEALKDKHGSALDLLEILEKIKFISEFLGNESNQKIIELYKRSANIVAIESKKDKKEYDGKVSIMALKDKNEKVLYKKIKEINKLVKKSLKHNDYHGALSALAGLEISIKNFFDNVEVNSEHANLRANRLMLLSKIKYLFNLVFDFSKVEISL